jgi:hypothetical protein
MATEPRDPEAVPDHLVREAEELTRIADEEGVGALIDVVQNPPLEWALADVLVPEVRILFAGDWEEKLIDDTAVVLKERLAQVTPYERRFLEAIAQCGSWTPSPGGEEVVPAWQQDLWDRHPFDVDEESAEQMEWSKVLTLRQPVIDEVFDAARRLASSGEDAVDTAVHLLPSFWGTLPDLMTVAVAATQPPAQR